MIVERGPIVRVVVGVLCLALLFHGEVTVKAEDLDKDRCGKTVESWAAAEILSSSSSSPTEASTILLDQFQLRELLFFLHIPRTGGRTFHQCFLKHLFGAADRCPRSYDKLRIDRSQPGCRLISTHDDYSLLDKLPDDATSVVTSLRHPVDRVLSAYEFSIEVAARSLRKPSTRRGGPTLPRASGQMSTLNIWPWKYLVPTMMYDLFARRDKRLASESLFDSESGLSDGENTSVSLNQSYDAPAYAMPFRDFVHHPIAHELVHNGATFQVAGLTNTSYSDKAGDIRSCIGKFPQLAHHVVEVAKNRLNSMLYVGITEKQKDSARFFAKVVGRQVSMENLFKSMMAQNNVRQASRPATQVLDDTQLHELKREEVIEELLKSYDGCVSRLRTSQVSRRKMSLEIFPSIRFSKQMRSSILDDVIDDVIKFNSLDVELFSHAQSISEKQLKFLEEEDLNFSYESVAGNWSRMSILETFMDTEGNTSIRYSQKGFVQTVFPVTIMSLVALGVVIFLVNRSRASRAKET